MDVQSKTIPTVKHKAEHLEATQQASVTPKHATMKDGQLYEMQLTRAKNATAEGRAEAS